MGYWRTRREARQAAAEYGRQKAKAWLEKVKRLEEDE